MYDDRERIYFNQQMIYYKDKNYNSGGTFEVIIGSNTTDYKTFSAPSLNISIIGENNLRRFCNLNYQDSVDLLTTLKDILANSEQIYSSGQTYLVQKQYQYDKCLKLEFVHIQTMNEKVVTISIIHNTTDFARVIIPFNTFKAFVIGILKVFVTDFINISFSFTSRNLLTEILSQNQLIKNGITTLPSSIISLENNNIKSNNNEIEKNPEVIEPENNMLETLEEFDKFLGQDMSNITIDELKQDSFLPTNEQKIPKQEIKSLLVTKTLNNDLYTIESLLNSANTRNDPLVAVMEVFRKSMNLDSTFTFLPDINENDLKSLIYSAKVVNTTTIQSYIKDNEPLPSNMSFFKYKPNMEKVNEFNVLLAYDLFLISVFIKQFRSKMESKNPDAMQNGAMLFLNYRCFIDPLSYSFLDPTKIKVFSNLVKSNFELYSTVGFFDYYQNKLTESGLPKISSMDIINSVNQITERLILNPAFSNFSIDVLHKEYHENGILKLNSKNNLSIEQIINEMIPLELFMLTNDFKIETQEQLDEMVNQFKQINGDVLSNEVIEFFDNKNPKKDVKEKQSNLLKTVKFFNDEIPLTYRDDFFEYIEKLCFENYDVLNSKYELDELGENIIKSIYIWNSTDNKNEPLTKFRTKLEECILEKDIILTKFKGEVEFKSESNDNWNFGE